jgi:hypothetical protein
MGHRPALRCLYIAAFTVGTWLHLFLGSAVAVCIGDCNSDGSVTVDELLTMVNIALGNAPASDCTAGDASTDGQITVDEILTAVGNALNGCPAEVTLRVGSAMGKPGEPVSFSVILSTAGKSVIATLNQISFPAGMQIAARANGQPDCSGSALDVGTAFLRQAGCVSFEDCQCVPGQDCTAVSVSAEADVPAPDGTVAYTCRANIAAAAVPGSRFVLACSGAEYVDVDINQFAADCTNGEIIVTAP